MLPILKYFGDGNIHKRRDIIDCAAKMLNLDDDCLSEKSSKGLFVYDIRGGWGLSYLKQSGLIESPERSSYRITEEGKKVLQSNPTTFRQSDLAKYPKYQDFIIRSHQKDDMDEAKDESLHSSESPEERIDAAQAQIRAAVCNDILERVRALSPNAFEQVVIELLIAMGYGDGTANSGIHTGKTGDGGIDGVINQDKLGLDTIYIQAKRYQEGNNVSAHDARDFVGALQGKESKGSRKGVFITTSDFTKEGREYAENIKDGKVILINGETLAGLMYDNDLGAVVSETIKIKKLDNDFFDE